MYEKQHTRIFGLHCMILDVSHATITSKIKNDFSIRFCSDLLFFHSIYHVSVFCVYV